MLAKAGLRLEAALRLLRPWRGVLGSDRIGRRLRAGAANGRSCYPRGASPSARVAALLVAAGAER